MQFYKYPAALLLESRGGEGGEAIPDVSFIISFLSPPRTRTLTLLMYPCIRTTRSLPLLPVGPATAVSVIPNPAPYYYSFFSSYFDFHSSFISLFLLFQNLFLHLYILLFILYFCFSFSSYSCSFFYSSFSFLFPVFLPFTFLGCAGNFGRNRNTYGSPGCSSICPCYCPSPSVSASVSAGHSARTHDDTSYDR